MVDDKHLLSVHVWYGPLEFTPPSITHTLVGTILSLCDMDMEFERVYGQTKEMNPDFVIGEG